MSTTMVGFLIYLLVMVDNFRDVATGAMIISGLLFATTLFISMIVTTESSREWMKTWWEKGVAILLACVFVFNGLLLALVPDREGAVLIVAGALGYEGVTTIIENERVQEVGGKSVDLLESWLDEQIERINEERQAEEVEPVEETA